jgi:signal transduction histidine kinase
MIRKLLLFSVFATLFFKAGIAQDIYTTEHYTSENGLPQNSVKSIAADSEGFIWLATEDGLVRFDGHRFYVYNQGNLGSKTNRVVNIEPALLIGDLANPVHPFRRTRKWCAIFVDQSAFIGIEYGRAVLDTSVFRRTPGEMLEATRMKALRKKLRNIYHVPGLPVDRWVEENTSGHFLINCADVQGSFYLCDSGHVAYYSKVNKEYQIALHAAKPWSYFSLSGRLYYFHDNAHFTQIYNQKVTTFPLEGEILQDPTYKAASSNIKLFWNNNSAQAFLFFNNNLYLLAEKAGGNLITELLIRNFDLNEKGIETIYFDNASGRTYLGSRTNGLFIVGKKQFNVITIKGDNIASSVYAQSVYGPGLILTPTGTIVGRDIVKGCVIEKSLPVLQKANPTDKGVITRDRNDRIWTKKNEDLFCLDKEGETILGQWRLVSEVKSMIQGKDGNVWIATVNTGLYIIDPDRMEIGPKRFNKDSLRNITYISSYGEKQLLVGTMEGLYKVDIPTKKISLVTETRELYIKSIHTEDVDNVWLSVAGKGLLLMDKAGMLVTFPMDKNRYLASPHCVVDDGTGYLWVPTNRGLFQISVRDLLHYSKLIKSGLGKDKTSTSRLVASELFYMYHTMEEGFNTNEFNGGCQPCALKLPNGVVSLPSLNGFVWFKPQEIQNVFPEGFITLDKTVLSGQEVPYSGDTILLPVSPENVRLYFSTANPGNDYNLNLSYKLIKQNDDEDRLNWLPIENNDFTVSYSSLEPGNYTLLVRKLNGFGINNYKVKRLSIIVPHQWYETVWAMFVFGLAFAGCLICAIYFYINFRLATAARENKKLEDIIVQRTASLRQALSDIEQSKSEVDKQMHLLSRLLTSITHDIQTPLQYIGFTANRISEMIDKNKSEKAKSLGQSISTISDRMSGMLVDLLDYIKVQVYGNHLSVEEIALKKLVDDKLELFKDVIHNNGSYFVNEIASELTVYSDYQFLAIIIHNLIDNAAKYTYNGKIRVYCHDAGVEKPELVISNTGTGISSDLLDMMNTRIMDKSLEELVENGRMKGLGLLMVKEMAELAGITIKVTQTDVTSFHVCFE